MSARQSVIPSRSPWPVILVGRDRLLLKSRQTVMERRGIAVQPMSPEQAEFPAHDGKPRLWAMCGSVEEGALVFLACTIRRYSAGSRLFLVEWKRAAGAERCLFHRVLDRETTEETLAEAVRNGWKMAATGRGD
ncbi:MAG TPA: hypothetical protein VHU89_08670 [Acidobacteriaceae bacterium]|jgi:hypothetical protein|nr:hypothetical protein [Acidobacteriaceae bacterium]